MSPQPPRFVTAPSIEIRQQTVGLAIVNDRSESNRSALTTAERHALEAAVEQLHNDRKFCALYPQARLACVVVLRNQAELRFQLYYLWAGQHLRFEVRAGSDTQINLFKRQVVVTINGMN